MPSTKSGRSAQGALAPHKAESNEWKSHSIDGNLFLCYAGAHPAKIGESAQKQGENNGINHDNARWRPV